MSSIRTNNGHPYEPKVSATTAENAIDTQREMTLQEAVKLYPKAIFFSALLSLAVVMEGYDTALIGNFYGVDTFNRKFGREVGDTGVYQLTSAWQSGLQNGVTAGQITGLLLGGYLADRFGYIKTLMGNLIVMIGFIFLFFFADNISMLFAAELLCGIPWGAFQTLTTTYAADVMPLKLRPILTTFVNMCWVIGQLTSVGVLRGALGIESDWGWRIPYAIQWLYPPIIIIGLCFAPESPAWFVKQDRVDAARGSLRKLCWGSDDVVDAHLNLLVYTNAAEKAVTSGTSYLDCLRGTHRRRTEVTCGTWVMQVLCGVWFGSNIIYFLQRNGVTEEMSFNIGLAQTSLGLIGTASAWLLMQYVGRRQIYLVGQSVMLLCLLLVGFMAIPAPTAALNWASAVIFCVFLFTYQLTVGPTCYSLVTELPSERLRVKTVVLARVAYLLASFGANWLNPPILNPLAWNLRGKGGFIWAGLNAATLVWAYFRLPEPSGLSSAELDVLFEEGRPARKFHKTALRPLRETEVVEEVFYAEQGNL